MVVLLCLVVFSVFVYVEAIVVDIKDVALVVGVVDGDLLRVDIVVPTVVGSCVDMNFFEVDLASTDQNNVRFMKYRYTIMVM